MEDMQDNMKIFKMYVSEFIGEQKREQKFYMKKNLIILFFEIEDKFNYRFRKLYLF